MRREPADEPGDEVGETGALYAAIEEAIDPPGPLDWDRVMQGVTHELFVADGPPDAVRALEEVLDVEHAPASRRCASERWLVRYTPGLASRQTTSRSPDDRRMLLAHGGLHSPVHLQRSGRGRLSEGVRAGCHASTTSAEIGPRWPVSSSPAVGRRRAEKSSRARQPAGTGL